MNSSVKLDAVLVQFKPLLFHGKVAVYPVLQTFVITTSHIQGGVVKIRNKLRRGAWPVEHLLSDRPSVIGHLRLSYASRLDPADNICNEVSSQIQAFMAGTKSPSWWPSGSAHISSSAVTGDCGLLVDLKQEVSVRRGSARTDLDERFCVLFLHFVACCLQGRGHLSEDERDEC